MNEYTEASIAWLDRRYRACSSDGVYLAHQPIYGIQDPNSEPNLISRYLRTFWMLHSLASLRGCSLLDVGSSEGYQASLARELLGLRVTCCDLSAEACKRASEIYGLDAYQADATRLPFADGQFDLVTCSETLEHVPGYSEALRELLRVASRAIVITVPYEPEEEVEENKKKGIVQAHIHSFDLRSFDYVRNHGLSVISSRHISPYLHHVNQVVERVRMTGRPGGFLATLLTAMFIRLDQYLVRLGNGYGSIRCIILQDSSAHLGNPVRRIKVAEILNHTVPHHLLAGDESDQARNAEPTAPQPTCYRGTP
jgi:ubiquinone/menaquinone biosynthesis C-methylase UbiE